MSSGTQHASTGQLEIIYFNTKLFKDVSLVPSHVFNNDSGTNNDYCVCIQHATLVACWWKRLRTWTHVRLQLKVLRAENAL